MSPLTGVLDTRSAPDQMPANGLRFRQNLQTVGQGKLRRGSGWRKFLSKASYNNSDFHDQLLLYSATRQPLTMLFGATSTRQINKFIIGSQTKLALLDEFAGNYRIIGTGYGGTPSTSASAPRFKCDQLGDTIVLTNDFDRPKYYVLEAAADNVGALVHEIPDLALIGLTRAACVWQWRNVMFLADVEMDYTRFSNRILWSQFDQPLQWDPADVQSIAGSKDLHRHERILAGAPSGNGFLIYTTHGIWEMVAVGGDQSFAFRRVYNGEDNEEMGTLFYPNTLVSRKETHMYLGSDGVYEYNQFSPSPQRVEWIHRSSNLLFDDIDSDACTVHIGASHGDEILFFVAKTSDANDCPSVGLRLNMQYQTADRIDHGFTALAKHHSQPIPTIRDFIVQHGICTIAALRTAGYPYVNEGLPNPLPSADAAFTPVSIYTDTPQTIGSVTVEDWTEPESDPDSLCALLAGATFDDFCKSCKGIPVLVGADSVDWCLKEFDPDVFYRERCANPTAVGTSSVDGYTSAVGSYVLDGITSIIRYTPMYAEDSIIKLEEIRLDFMEHEGTDSEIGLRVGISSQLRDPNFDGCGILWHQHTKKRIKCLSTVTAERHNIQNTMPTDFVAWIFLREGRRLYVEMRIDGTGGDAIFSKAVAKVSASQTENY